MMMMTSTEYKARIQELENEFQQEGLKINNPKKKQIAIITVCVYITNFIKLLIEILQGAGFEVDWYNYSEQDTKEFNMDLEIADLAEHYDKVIVFNNSYEIIAAAALKAFKGLIDTTGTQAYCLVGRTRGLLNNVVDMLLEYRMNFAVVSDTLQACSYAHNYDGIVVLDPAASLIAYPFHAPIFKLFPWNTVSDENKEVYDLSKEIALRIGGQIL